MKPRDRFRWGLLRRTTFCASLALTTLPGAAQEPGTAASPNRTDIEVLARRDLAVPTRDGVRLTTDVLLPDAEGPFPAILLRTPYGRASALGAWGGERLAARGYAVVAQDLRGKGDSGGSYDLPWVREGRDGYDTVEWIARQSWSNGAVGMLGGSALGQAQWAAAAERPPHLEALFVFPAISDPFFGGAYDSGVFSLTPFWAYQNSLARERPLPEFEWRSLLTLPLSRVDESTFGESVPIWDRYLELDEQDEWPTLHWPDDVRRIEIPVMHVMALWDGDGIGPVLNWAALRQKPNQRLVFGPWDHGMSMPARRGDVDYGDASRISLLELILSWFDTWLMGRDAGLDTRSRARVFVTGCNEWIDLADWPPPDARPVSYHLGAGSPELAGTLSRSPTGDPSTSSYRFDPMQPRLMSFEESVFSETTVLPFPAPANDALLFLTEPFVEPVVIGAPVELDLDISSTGRDADVFALLVDVSPAGEARALTHPGKLRLGYRDGWSSYRPLEPGRVETVRVRLWDVAHRIGTRHRLGLVIRSDWLPRWSRNLGTAEPIASAERGVAVEQTIHHGGPAGSRLRLRELVQTCAD